MKEAAKIANPQESPPGVEAPPDTDTPKRVYAEVYDVMIRYVDIAKANEVASDTVELYLDFLSHG